MINILRFLLMTGVLRAAVMAAFFATFLLGYCPVVVIPNPIDPLDIDHPTLFPQFYRNPAIAESRTFFNLLLDRLDNRGILNRQSQLIPLTAAGLVKSFTCFPLGDAQLSTGGLDDLTLLSRA